MENEEKKRWPVPVVVEVSALALCLVLGFVFFLLRGCDWDLLALALWAVVLLVSGILLLRAERRLRESRQEEEPAED